MAGSGVRVKKANRKATKGQKKPWKKGQSSVYNPECNKYRLEAKKRAVFGSPGFGNLTVEKLAAHNRLISENQCDDDESLSVGGDSAISAFTNCTLPSFSRLIQNWNPGSLLHKEMIAVLAAVTDVLKTFDGKETETEYFAALMTTLDVVDTDEGVTAVICLLSMVVKRLNENVLKLKGDSSCDIFIKYLEKYKDSEHGALLRNLLKITYAFLKVRSSWDESTCEKLKIVLNFTTHPKPKVRKAAHQIVRSLIIDSNFTSSDIHPGAAVVADFCINKLKGKKGVASVAAKDMFYVLSLLEEILGVFPKSSIKLLCETVLSVMSLSNSMLTSKCLRALKGLFEMKPKPENLPANLNAQIIMALYNQQPNVKDYYSLINWLQLMDAAIKNLKNLDEKLCIRHLPKFYDTAVKYFKNDNEEVLQCVAFVLKDLVYKCIDPSGEVFQQYLLDDAISNPMHKMFHSVEECLSYQYHKAWQYVFSVLCTFFEVMGKHCYTVMLKCLQALADMHDTYNFPHVSELEKAIGTAIQHMGPKVVLEVVPLQISTNNDRPDFPRSWLLPLLRDYTKKTELQFFIKYFMPLAERLQNKMLALRYEKKEIESKLYDHICSQIWSLLPGFCNEPTDLKQCFKDVAPTLGMLLNEKPSTRNILANDCMSSLRLIVLSSLRILVSKNLEKEENRSELSRFCKNYLAIIFNMYATEPEVPPKLTESMKRNDEEHQREIQNKVNVYLKYEERVRLAAYDTCKAFLQITDKKLCHDLFNKALQKLLEPEVEPFEQQALIDICRAILPYLESVSEVMKIYEYCKPLLKDSNHTTQKKSYSVMNEICSCKSEACKQFVQENLEDIRPLLCGAVQGLKPSTRALRLNILGHIIKQLTKNEQEFVTTFVVPEAVLGTKENSVKARTSAYNLLIEIGNTMLSWHADNPKGAIMEYMKSLLAGLAGSPHHMSATILAIGRVLYEFKDKMDSNLIHMLIENTCLLLTSKSREVVESAISFLKILFSAIDTQDLAQHVEYMVTSITSISEDNQRHFRFKAKELLTRLIRKFGFEMISKLVPDSYQKQLTNIRKLEARKARKKNADVDEMDAEPKEAKSEGADALLIDSDDEIPLELESEKHSKVSVKYRKKTDRMIEEHGEDDIVDFMDPAVNKRLLTAKEKSGNREKSTGKTEKGFPLSKDGRLIITEDTDDEEENTKESKELDKRKLAQMGILFKQNKRKFDDLDDGDDGSEAGNNTVARGIHRTLEPKTKKITPGSEFRAKKAGGDMKKGKFDPYAYVPLNRQILNKRKQVKVKGQFKNIVKGAKKGAFIGVKRKMREARKKKNK